jgi:sulfoxide reductase heme-binding subunit YedZ
MTTWYVARGTGITALGLLTLVLVLGVLSRRGAPLPGLPRFVTAGLHRNAALLAVAFLAVHVATVVADPYAMTGIADVVVPFLSGYRPWWVGLGTVALDLLLALVISSVLRHRLSDRAWRTVHAAAYLCWPSAVVHGIGAGTDRTELWSLAVTALCVAAVGSAAVWRATSPSFPKAPLPSAPVAVR